MDYYLQEAVTLLLMGVDLMLDSKCSTYHAASDYMFVIVVDGGQKTN